MGSVVIKYKNMDKHIQINWPKQAKNVGKQSGQ